MATWMIVLFVSMSGSLSLSEREPEYFSPRSCKELMLRYKTNEDGLYYLTTASGVVYQTYCDMTTAGGGWTLVASVHENNMYGKCTTGDRWSSQQGNSPDVPEGDGSWSNTVTFGTAEAATSDDFKNPGYYDITAKDVAVWHVPNNEQVNRWKLTSFLRYHTDTQFLNSYKGNLYNLFKQFPVKYNIGSCPDNHGPSIPVVYDVGDATSNHNLFGPDARARSKPGFITFRPLNTERAAMAICLGVKPTDCNTEHLPGSHSVKAAFTLHTTNHADKQEVIHFLWRVTKALCESCIGGGGYFHEASPRQCGDFTSLDWDGYGTHTGWSASKQLIEAAVLIFYR